MPAKLVRPAVLGEGREGEAWGWCCLLPSFLSAPQVQAEDGCRGWGVFAEACSEPLGSGAVTSDPVPGPGPKQPEVAESRDWPGAFRTLALSQELASGLTWVDSEGSSSFPVQCRWLSPAEMNLPPLYSGVRWDGLQVVGAVV